MSKKNNERRRTYATRKSEKKEKRKPNALMIFLGLPVCAFTLLAATYLTSQSHRDKDQNQESQVVTPTPDWTTDPEEAYIVVPSATVEDYTINPQLFLNLPFYDDYQGNRTESISTWLYGAGASALLPHLTDLTKEVVIRYFEDSAQKNQDTFLRALSFVHRIFPTGDYNFGPDIPNDIVMIQLTIQHILKNPENELFRLPDLDNPEN